MPDCDPEPLGLPFRLLDRTLPGVEANLALDEALLQHVEEERGTPVLRFWELPELAVVLGASGRLREDVRVEACQADGVPIARRSSGGGTVVIGPGALNVTVVLPGDAAPGLAAVDLAQRFVLERIAHSLRGRGLPVEVRGSGDLTIGSRKFSGSAQRRLKRYFLVHASILYRFPLERITRYTALPHRQPDYRQGRAHRDFVTNLELPRDELWEAVRASWLGPDGRFGAIDVPESPVRELVATKFGDPGWVARF